MDMRNGKSQGAVADRSNIQTAQRAPVATRSADGCPLCGEENRRLHVHANYNLSGATDSDYQVVECRECRFRYLYPRPEDEELNRFYQSDYPAHSLQLRCDGLTAEQASLNRRFLKVAALRQRLIQRFRPGSLAGKRVLDIGCGNGAFLLDLAQRQQVEGWGLDISEGALALVAKQAEALEVKLRLVKGDLAGARLPAGHFDVITLWHVLEHDGDPVGNLQRVRNWLRPGGLVLAEVPNSDGLIAKLCGSNWLGWDLPRHLVHFTPSSLRRAAVMAGLGHVRILHEFTLDPVCLSPLLASMAIWRQRRRRRPRMKRLAYRRFDGLAGAAVRLINGLERLLGGNGLVLVAERVDSEVGGQKSEVGGRRSEVRGPTSDL